MTFIQQSLFAGLHSLVRIHGLTVIAVLVTDLVSTLSSPLHIGTYNHFRRTLLWDTVWHRSEAGEAEYS